MIVKVKDSKYEFDEVLVLLFSRSSHQEVFYIKKLFVKVIHKNHRKTTVPEAFFNKVACLRHKKRLSHRRFFVNFAKFLRTALSDCFCFSPILIKDALRS